MGEQLNSNVTTNNANGIAGQDQLQQDYYYAHPQSASAPPHDHHIHHQLINVPDSSAYPTPTTGNHHLARPPHSLKSNTPAVPAVTSVTAFAVVDEHYSQQQPNSDQLPCCGIGFGWFLFMLGFIFPLLWCIGAGHLLCSKKYDRRERPGFIACTVLAVIFIVLLVLRLAFTIYVYAYLNSSQEYY